MIRFILIQEHAAKKENKVNIDYYKQEMEEKGK